MLAVMRKFDANPLLCNYILAEQLPDYGGGGGGTSGGGSPGTPSGGRSGIPPGENGGVGANSYILLVPVQNSSSGLAYFGFYDLSNLNDVDDGSYYTYRVEEVDINRVPTVRRIAINYVDLGPLKLTLSLSATNDLQQVVTASTTVQLGNTVPTYSLMTKLVDLQLTGFQPQLTISKAANAGPMIIVAVTIYGESEDVTL
jgi:hypothetical protein